VHPQLAEVIDSLDHAQTRLELLADTVPDDRWNRRSDPSRWSVAECVAHLNLTSEAYVPRIQKAIEEARALPRVDGRNYNRDLIGRIFAALVGPLPKIGKMRIGRVKTMPGFVPSGDLPRQLLLAEFRKLQMQLAAMVRESDGLAIDKVSITSPFGEKVHYNCYSVFVIIPRHQERHLQQAEMVWTS
jgi:hypothetical protein